MMRTPFTCDDTDALVAYVYDESDASLGADIAAHLTGCAACRHEVAALGGVRTALSHWSPPAPPLRFALAAQEIQPSTRGWHVPVWAQLAAACVAVAVSAAVANVQVRHDQSGWTLTTGWLTPSLDHSAGRPNGDWQPALAALEDTLRRELAPPPLAGPASATSVPSTLDQATVARIRSLIQESEKRQQQELALRLTQFGRDVDVQRRADLMRVEQGIGQLEGRTGAEVARQREMLNYIVRAGMRPPQ